MAFNFPSNPTAGQVYGNYTYNATTNAWDIISFSDGIPAGVIMAWGASSAPANWLICDGSAISRSTYASLFNAIGTSYGVGDGSTTFNLPDLRGRVIVGKNGATFGTLGATGGSETHTHGSSSMIARWFNLYYQNRTADSWTATNSHSASIPGASSSSTTNGIAIGGNTDSGSSIQPYQVANYIIKYSAANTPGDSELATRVGALETATNLTNLSGLVPVIPSSITVGSGTATASSVGVITVTGASSVSLNNIFDDPYGEYVVQYTLQTSANTRPTFRARISGTDDSGSTYSGRNYTVEQGSASAGGTTTTIPYPHPGTGAGTWHFANMKFFKMYDNTAYGIIEMMGTGSYGSIRYGTVQHQNPSYVDGLTFFPESSGTITGKITIFKFRK